MLVVGFVVGIAAASNDAADTRRMFEFSFRGEPMARWTWAEGNSTVAELMEMIGRFNRRSGPFTLRDPDGMRIQNRVRVGEFHESGIVYEIAAGADAAILPTVTPAGSKARKTYRPTTRPSNAAEVVLEDDMVTGLDDRNAKVVWIPPEARGIRRGAFRDCTKLEKVVFAAGGKLEVIEAAAFIRCTKLKSITIPATVQRIGRAEFRVDFFGGRPDGAFEQSGLEEILFEDGCRLREIGDMTFSSARSLRGIDVPESVELVGFGAFWHCTRLAHVSWAEDARVSRIGGWAFANSGVTEVEIPRRVRALEESTFNSCPTLMRVRCRARSLLKRVRPGAFWNCPYLRLLEVPRAAALDAGTVPKACRVVRVGGIWSLVRRALD